jgi:hypothetical protein
MLASELGSAPTFYITLYTLAMSGKRGTVYIASLPAAAVRDLSNWEHLAGRDRERFALMVQDSFTTSCDYISIERLEPSEQLMPVRQLFDVLYNPIGDNSISVPNLNWSRLLKVRSLKGVGFLALPTERKYTWLEWFGSWLEEPARRCVLLTCTGKYPEKQDQAAV